MKQKKAGKRMWNWRRGFVTLTIIASAACGAEASESIVEIPKSVERLVVETADGQTITIDLGGTFGTTVSFRKSAEPIGDKEREAADRGSSTLRIFDGSLASLKDGEWVGTDEDKNWNETTSVKKQESPAQSKKNRKDTGKPQKPLPGW